MERKITFPKEFIFGVGSSSYQVEGAHDKDGKGPSIWDVYVKEHLDNIIDKSTGNDACKSYEFVEKDIEAVKYLKVDSYRFSISWPRLCPDGDIRNINQNAVDYYNKLINALIENNIQPMVTMYHWDLPYELQKFGGWANPIIVDYFEDYARKLLELFGDRVKLWVTLNEPHLHSTLGYGMEKNMPIHAPGLQAKARVVEYLAGHYMLLAHARVYRLYEKHFRDLQHGKVGLALDLFYYFPETDSKNDKQATSRVKSIMIDWFVHPIFSKHGDYPYEMKKLIEQKSCDEGRSKSRLPKFTEEEVEMVKGSADFLGINHYTTFYVKDFTKEDNPEHETYDTYAIIKMRSEKNGKMLRPEWISMEPQGLSLLINYLSEVYDYPAIIITENGCGNVDDSLDDEMKSEYLKKYLFEVARSIEAGCKIQGYFGWSLLDSYEWTSGYTERFGFFHVDFESNQRTRTPKKSAEYYKSIISNRSMCMD